MVHIQVFHPQGHFPAAAGFFGEQVMDLPPHHVSDDFAPVGPGRVQRGHRHTVAQDGDAVGQFQDFVQLVRNVNAGDAAPAQFLQNVQEHARLMGGQRRRRFVKNQDFGFF